MSVSVLGKRSSEMPQESVAKMAKTHSNEVIIYVHVETTGLNAVTHKTAEVALLVIDDLEGKKIASYNSFVNLTNRDWKLFDQKAQDANGITKEMTRSGKTALQIATDINALIAKHRLNRSNTRIISHALEFERPFLKQVWPESEQLPWQDLKTLFETAVIPWIAPGAPRSFRRGDMAKQLRMTKVPTPHSAASVVNHFAAMHDRILRPTHTPPFYSMPTYEGLQRSRSMSMLWPVDFDADATEVMIEGEKRHMVKGSAAWKVWNKQGVSNSDAPCIMEASTFWKTPQTLWLEKTDRSPEEALSEAGQRGLALEPQALAAFIRETGMNMRPSCIECPSDPWLRVSLDGLSDDGTVILDSICPGEKSYETARSGTLAKHYLYKLQAGMMACPTALYAIAWVWDPIQGGLPIKVMPNKAMQEEMLPKLKLFADRIALDAAP